MEDGCEKSPALAVGGGWIDLYSHGHVVVESWKERGGGKECERSGCEGGELG